MRKHDVERHHQSPVAQFGMGDDRVCQQDAGPFQRGIEGVVGPAETQAASDISAGDPRGVEAVRAAGNPRLAGQLVIMDERHVANCGVDS
jgi:hypothetical protein